jgi:hypothetical protein
MPIAILSVQSEFVATVVTKTQHIIRTSVCSQTSTSDSALGWTLNVEVNLTEAK